MRQFALRFLLTRLESVLVRSAVRSSVCTYVRMFVRPFVRMYAPVLSKFFHFLNKLPLASGKNLKRANLYC